jgi:superfamily II DNA or RNA helicase
MLDTTPSPGQLVTVRQRRFVVTGVRPSALPIDAGGSVRTTPQHLVALSSVEDDGLGEELQVVWELEPGRQVFERANLPDPSQGFESPARLDAFLHAVRWGAISSADTKSLHAPFRSGITIEDYQLDPVARALQMPRVNILLADDVGLGKTIESGLVVQELLLRHRARTVLVVCPAGIQIQWRDQMRDKFGLDFRIVDSSLMRELRRTRGLHVNPWSHFPRLITSIDFLKRERPLRLFRELLPGEGEPAYPRRFDLLIVDEAHNVAPSGRGKYAQDSLRTDAIRKLAPHFEHKLFLTATPHNGYRESFTALLELLDNQRFHRDAPIDRNQLAAVMVRRMKTELPPGPDGKERFLKREIVPIEVPYTDAERRAHHALTEYAKSRQQGANEDGERFATEFVLKLLKKRLFSSPAAFLTTLEKHERGIRSAKKRKKTTRAGPSTGVLRRMVDEVDDDHADDDEYEETSGEAVETTTQLFRDLSDDEERLLKEMRAYAEKASAKPDAKAEQLLGWLRKVLKQGKTWTNERVIIFTEYRATQKWLLDILTTAGFADGERLMTLYGGMDSDERERVKAAFQADPRTSEVRILLGTDAASEGIDLQNHCHLVTHYEIPWNPNRMEQRNGRVDRHGQHKRVQIHHFVGKGWQAQAGSHQAPGDLEGDLEFLMRAAVKVETIREDLGKVGDVIAQQVEEAMLGKRRTLNTDAAMKTAAEIKSVLRVERHLREQIAKLQEKLTQTSVDLDLTPDHVKSVVDVALELAEQPPLEATTVERTDEAGRTTSVPAFVMPPLRGSWALCADGLAHPHTQAVRPIVFDQALAGERDDVVLVHLNHRLMQMSLGLLRAEIWGTGEKSGARSLRRVTARTLPDALSQQTVLAAHARLVVLGADNTRLHEEIIVAGGTVKDGRFARLGVTELGKVIDGALDKEAPTKVQKALAERWPSHRESLTQALDARMADRVRSLERDFVDRAEKEASDLKTILLELKRNIEERFEEAKQLVLEGFQDKEREQFERNRKSLLDRAAAIPAEIIRETAALRARYETPTPRLFPVSVTYFVPERLAHAEGKN